jgi:N6-adenosine-specific RNA methylase IME4
VKLRGHSTWLYAPVQEHSHKPEEQYALIERLSDGPYLEFFARRRQHGWFAWGNEITADIVIPGYPVPSDGRFHGGL